MHILLLLQGAFSLWMLVDAVGRGCKCHWYWVIMMPGGPFVYFFVVKINDPEMRKLRSKLLKKKVSVEQLRYQAETSPSLRNRILFAQGLHDTGEYAEAAKVFSEIVATDRKDKQALHGLGLCLLKLRETKRAVEALEQVVTIDMGYDDYSACADLAGAYWELDEKEKAIRVFEKLLSQSQRLSHRTEYARYLVQAGEQEKARELLNGALNDYQHSPRYVRKNERRWAQEAKTLLKGLA